MNTPYQIQYEAFEKRKPVGYMMRDTPNSMQNLPTILLHMGAFQSSTKAWHTRAIPLS